jgi:hypothetical protein
MCIYHFLQSWLLFLVKSLSIFYYVYYYYDLYLYHNPKHQPFLYGDGMSHHHWRQPMGYLRSRSEDPRNFRKVKAITTQNLYCRNEKPAWMQYFTTISGKNRKFPIMQIILMIVIQLVTIVFLVFFVLHLVVPCGWDFLLVASWLPT